MKKLTTEIFIKRVENIFPEYDFSLVKYISTYDKVKIICPKCGEQEIKATYLLSGRGCKCLKNRYIAFNSKRPDVEKINQKFPNFDIDWTTYKSCMENVKIRCKICNKYFEKSYNALKSKNTGCPWCSGNYKSLDMVLKELNEKYGNELFDYSLIIDYNNNREKKKFICKKCNKVFYSNIHDMLSKEGRKCPYCYDESKGERKIRLFLEKEGINFIKEKRFKDCMDINTLPFDFYLPDYSCLIEFQGEQHYKPSFRGKNNLELIQKHDKIKKDFAISNGFNFLEIPSWKFDDIEGILNENIRESFKKRAS